MNQRCSIGEHYRAKFAWQGTKKLLKIRMSIQPAREPQEILYLLSVQSRVDLGDAGEMRIPHTG